MNLKETSVSHYKLPNQAITCKLAGIEAHMLTANARFSFLGVVGKKKKKKPEEEVCLTIPPWSKIQAPQIGSQTPHTGSKPPLLWRSIDQHGSKHFKDQDCWKAREEMMSSTPGNKSHTSIKYEQYCTPFQQEEIYIWRIKCLCHEEWNPPLTIM